MTDLYLFLSGNVPGGISLYVLLVLLIGITLFFISKNNDLFTRSRSKRFFIGIWLFLTAGYAGLWVSNPPAGKMQRYCVVVAGEAGKGPDWIAGYLEAALAKTIRPYRDSNDVHFLQSWIKGGGLNATGEPAFWDSLMSRLPVQHFARVSVALESAKPVLHAVVYDKPGGKVVRETRLQFDLNTPRSGLGELIGWLGEPFSLRTNSTEPDRPDSLLARAGALFMRGEYEESGRLAAQRFAETPDDLQTRKWHYINEVKRAGRLKEQQESRRKNSLDVQKFPWQITLNAARRELAGMVQENLRNDVTDDLLIAMTAESFMLDEYYGDAEEFLEIGYGLNPLNLDILVRLSRLHFTRYRDLGFENETAILRRILDICPFHESALERLAERELPRVNLEKATGEELRTRLHHALKINPASSRIWVLQGKYDNALMKYTEALKAFKNADSLRPGNGVLKYNIGVTLFRLEDFDHAADYFQEAVRLNDYIDAHLYLGAIYKQRGDYEKALERFRYRVANKGDEDDVYVVEAMKGIRECLERLNIPIPQ